MNDLLFLDTHILLWAVLKPEELSPDIKDCIGLAQEHKNLCFCSISLWEIAMLQFKKRIHIYETIQEFLYSITHIAGLSIQDISPEIAAESVLLMDNFHGDPADRLIVATTKVRGATLITRDQNILKWAKSGSY
jgi:PIN domain nuclease of toxin-antitoxin system